jgi:hypothetical protein
VQHKSKTAINKIIIIINFNNTTTGVSLAVFGSKNYNPKSIHGKDEATRVHRWQHQTCKLTSKPARVNH